MIIAPLVNLASGFLDSLIPASSSAKTTAPSSPFAHLLSSLEQLEQSSLTQYQQVTKQISDFTNAAGSLKL
jgi:hypothetical protein